MKPFQTFVMSMAVLLLAATPPQAQSDEEVISGKELLQTCVSESTSLTDGKPFCLRYLAGLVVTVSQIQEQDPGTRLFCVNPQQVSLEEVHQTVVKSLKENSERLNEDAYVLVSEALHRKYPCAPPAPQ